MSLKIVCPQCGYWKEISAAAAPSRCVKATCPKCRHIFDVDPVSMRQRVTGNSMPSQPYPHAEENKISLERGLEGKANKYLFVTFLLLIIVTVGIKLWADSRYEAIPYPNLLAASSKGIAVGCGKNVYVYSSAGELLHSYLLPAGVQPTQLFWDRGILCLADMKSKKVLELDSQETRERGFSGASISAQFKIAREPGSGSLFVSDSASHRILVFDDNGKFLRNFGVEGTDPGQLKFPNELAFDENGLLLIANTKRPALDMYSLDGKFEGTLITPAGDPIHRYPTDIALTTDRLLTLEADGFLHRAKVRVYDRKGVRIAEVDTGDAKVIGDIVVDGDRLLISDCVNRKVNVFSLQDLGSLGAFSSELANKCTEWQREATLFKKISNFALIHLLIFCAPVIIFYLRMKQKESRAVAKVDVTVLSSKPTGTGPKGVDDLFLGGPVNARQVTVSIILLGAGSVSLSLLLIMFHLGGKVNLASITAFLAADLAFLFGILLFVKAGGIARLNRKQAVSFFKRLIRDGMLDLVPEEQVERVALAQQGQSAQTLLLLVFTDKRLLQYSCSWEKFNKIEQYPYQSITKVTHPSTRLLGLVKYIAVSVLIEGRALELAYYSPHASFLQLLSEEFSARIGRASEFAYATLCLTCRKPLQGDYCTACATKLGPNPQAMWLSLAFPGLGQLRNGELQKGLLFIILTVTSLVSGYLGIRGWFFEGADVTLQQKINLTVLMILAPIWYAANVVDAFKSSMRGRRPG